MKKSTISTLIFIFFGVIYSSAISLDNVIKAISSIRCASADVSFEVQMPSSPDPVTYSISMNYTLPGDSLSPCDYLIDWELPRNGKTSKGFSSYHDGNHFRYRDSRLQEYHFVSDPNPFTSEGGGVQRNVQFANLLPPFIAEQLIEMSTDSSYIDTYNEKTATLSGVRRLKGFDALEYNYTFDPQTGMPIKIDFVYNPSGISEQIVTITYTWHSPLETDNCPVFDESFLISRYGDIFEKFRTSNFRAENMKDSPLPTFTYTDATGYRKGHSRNEKDFEAPLLLFFADSGISDFETTLKKIRDILMTLPMNVNIIYVFKDNIIPDGFSLEEQEYTASSPNGLIQKCGVASYPTFMLAGTDGIVKMVFLGISENLDTDISQNLMFIE